MSTNTESSESYDPTVLERVAENPRPAMIWASVLGGLVLLQLGSLLEGIGLLIKGIISGFPAGNPGLETVESFIKAAGDIPTLLSRDLIPNQGWQAGPNGPWMGTFPRNLGVDFGLEPKHAWLLRFLLAYAYAIALFGWILNGYRIFREHYRYADWTPTDDVIDRLKRHRWGQFGITIVFAFLVMSMFAPTLGPTTFEQNINQPYSYEIKYFDEDAAEVDSILVGDANIGSQSKGAGVNNEGPWGYDNYGRFHPAGTLSNGKDLFTFMMYGARVSLFVGLLAIGISGILATVFALITAYYKGLVDLAVVIGGDSVMAIPQLLLLILVAAVYRGHWIDQIYNGGFLIALVLGLTSWPFLWRAVRGPAFQVSTQEWVDAAKSYGQRPSVTMRKHMFPYIVGYLLIYASMSLGGVIIATSALSFLGLGVNSPTPEWGRAVSMGQPYIATQSWHISLIPGLMIVAIVTAFNALGDGIRDAIDPQADIGGGSSEVSAAGGGGG